MKSVITEVQCGALSAIPSSCLTTKAKHFSSSRAGSTGKAEPDGQQLLREVSRKFVLRPLLDCACAARHRWISGEDAQGRRMRWGAVSTFARKWYGALHAHRPLDVENRIPVRNSGAAVRTRVSCRESAHAAAAAEAIVAFLEPCSSSSKRPELSGGLIAREEDQLGDIRQSRQPGRRRRSTPVDDLEEKREQPK
jgi:hypothetical protein